MRRVGTGVVSASIFVVLAYLSISLWHDRNGYAELFVAFGPDGLPIVEVDIAGVPQNLAIDLGSYHQIVLRSTILESMDIEPCGVERWYNYQGSEFLYSKYGIERVKVGSLSFKNVIAVAIPEKREGDFTIWRDSERACPINRPRKVGTLGMGLLKKTNLLLDFKNKKIVATNDLRKLTRSGYDVSSFQRIPFTASPLGIILPVETEIGTVSLLLDTGFTYTTLRKSLYPKHVERTIERHGFPVINSKKFNVGGTDFQEQDLFFLDFTEMLNEIDGVIGMDFIKNVVIYIDFTNNTLYIQ